MNHEQSLESEPESWRLGGPGAQAAERWETLLSATHLPWSSSPVDGKAFFHAAARRWWLDDIALVDCACSPCFGSRDRAEIARTDGEFLVLLTLLEGSESVRQRERGASLAAGDVVFWHSNTPTEFAVHEPLRKRSMMIPCAALEEAGLIGLLDGHTRLGKGTPGIGLLIAYLDALPSTLRALHLSQRHALRNAALELLGVVASSRSALPDADAVHVVMRQKIERYIHAHLLDEGLTLSSIARAHHISPRTLNRIFSRTGSTVDEVMRLQRLARARNELMSTSVKVSAIAHRWGFCDGSHFARAFKSHYGCTPTECRAMGDVSVSGGAQIQ